MPGLDIHNQTYVGVNQGQSVSIINTGNQGILYQASTVGDTISQTIYDGIIAPGATLIVPYSVFLLADNPGAQCDLTYANPSTAGLSTAEKQLIQAVIANEILAETLKPSHASLDYPSNTAAL